jgi:2-dehydro-3-deoxyphosphogluconate aldolase/(4S)-4-hydroxy-2-oxoglutarate aldolase
VTTLTEGLRRHGLLAIVRAGDAQDAVRACVNLAEVGIHLLEISLVTPGALDALGEARLRLGPEVALGAGTVRSAADADAACRAGAAFLVSPHTDAEVARAALDAGVDLLPGAMTPTEVVRAAELGCGLVKLFPAGVLGPRYVAELLAPMPELRLVPTGGVSLANAADFIAAGAAGLAVGGELSRPALADPSRLAAVARTLLAAVRPQNEGATSDGS